MCASLKSSFCFSCSLEALHNNESQHLKRADSISWQIPTKWCFLFTNVSFFLPHEIPLKTSLLPIDMHLKKCYSLCVCNSNSYVKSSFKNLSSQFFFFVFVCLFVWTQGLTMLPRPASNSCLSLSSNWNYRNMPSCQILLQFLISMCFVCLQHFIFVTQLLLFHIK